MAISRGASAPKRLVLLGATGSIGKSCARVILDNPGRFQVEAVVGGRDGAALARTAIELGAKFAAISDPSGYADLKSRPVRARRGGRLRRGGDGGRRALAG